MSVKRRQTENHRRLQEADKARVNHNKPPGGNVRKTALARKLESLRAKKRE